MGRSVTFGASMTIRTIELAREAILDAFAEHDSVEIDLSDIAEADLSLVQLVAAARMHAARQGKGLRLTHPANAALAALLQRAGFLAEPTTEDLAFWCHGDQLQ